MLETELHINSKNVFSATWDPKFNPNSTIASATECDVSECTDMHKEKLRNVRIQSFERNQLSHANWNSGGSNQKSVVCRDFSQEFLRGTADQGQLRAYNIVSMWNEFSSNCPEVKVLLR